MLNHDTDSYCKISRAFLGGQPSGHLTRDRIVDNITLYWLTGTGASAAREYWENGPAADRAAGQARPQVLVPVGFTVFPGEIFRAPHSWVQEGLPHPCLLPRGRQGAATSPPGKSPSCSRPKSGQHSGHCANDRPPPATGIRGRPNLIYYKPARPRRPLRRPGTAAAVLTGGPRGPQTSTQIGKKVGRRPEGRGAHVHLDGLGQTH
jgi:hypothetical protein